ncbi:MAG: nucleoporin complex subunit 54-domain-containing protein [Lentinula lateritia]|uniref:Nucleoporin complex subunit 54-domain-containing protein n=1 Tax=Lentinula lateritia TaxID=40482 RepID=A0ABQ8VKJ8_9AGAR|nr:MAG: nucleoporin complex subunit 54-domain-containing protein [Lentinula lateritia]KAJ4495309.1 nucleoporin complex subunit 54-domain-containing protein [Lentinula lateritia]
MSLFGTSATPASGTSLFGAVNSNPGATTNPPAGGSTFGGFGAQNTNNNANPQQSAPSSFGSSTNTNSVAQQPSGNPLFGGSNTNTGTGSSIFGNNATGNSLFGKPATTTNTGSSIFGGQTNAPAATGGNPLFGPGTVQPAQPAGSSGSSFFATPPGGQQQQNPNQPKPGLFGNTNTNVNPLFGGASTPNTNTSGSIFGSASTSNPLFGGSSTGQQSGTGTGSLFGSANAAPMNATSGSMLGGNSTLGVSALGASALGKPLGGLVSSTVGSHNQSADAQVQFARLQEKIEGIVGAWDARNPATCRFQHYFYNIVEPSQVNLYGRPPNAVNEALWQKAVRENPDPSCLVPVLAIGFDDLRGRVDAQVSQSAAHKEKLLELQQKLRTLSTNHSTLTVPRLQRYSALQTQLTHRLLRLIQHLHLLIPSVRSSAINENEEALRGVLEEVVTEVGVGASNAGLRSNSEVFGKGRLKSKLGELWAVVGALKAREQSLNATFGGSSEWRVVDEEGLARIAQILAEQQAGLAHLTKILHKDLKDLAIIMGTAEGAGEDIGPDDVLRSSFGSRDNSMQSSTLRMSAFR